jgi:hypothetical protein
MDNPQQQAIDNTHLHYVFIMDAHVPETSQAQKLRRATQRTP